MSRASRDIIVANSNGLHARPAMQFVDLANSFSSAVKVTRISRGEGGGENSDGDDSTVEADGKSVMQMIVLEATQGTKLRIEADGEDARQAVEKLAELFESKFGEE